MNVLDVAFGHPRGPLGRLWGVIMASSTVKRNEWMLSLLDIQRDDRILEVGCGPGALLQSLAAKATAGFKAQRPGHPGRAGAIGGRLRYGAPL